MHAEHGLHVHSVSPPEVARLVSVTRHSAVVELLQTAARDFRFEALGDVDEVRVVCDIGDARPPPPPPPTPPKLPLDVSEHRAAAGEDEQEMPRSGSSTHFIEAERPASSGAAALPLPPIVQEGHNWGLIVSVYPMVYIGTTPRRRRNPNLTGSRRRRTSDGCELVGQQRMERAAAQVMSSFVGQQLMQIEARYLGLPGNSGSGAAALPPASSGAAKPKSKKVRANDEETQQPSSGSRPSRALMTTTTTTTTRAAATTATPTTRWSTWESSSPPGAAAAGPQKTEFVVRSGG